MKITHRDGSLSLSAADGSPIVIEDRGPIVWGQSVSLIPRDGTLTLIPRDPSPVAVEWTITCTGGAVPDDDPAEEEEADEDDGGPTVEDLAPLAAALSCSLDEARGCWDRLFPLVNSDDAAQHAQVVELLRALHPPEAVVGAMLAMWGAEDGGSLWEMLRAVLPDWTTARAHLRTLFWGVLDACAVALPSPVAILALEHDEERQRARKNISSLVFACNKLKDIEDTDEEGFRYYAWDVADDLTSAGFPEEAWEPLLRPLLTRLLNGERAAPEGSAACP